MAGTDPDLLWAQLKPPDLPVPKEGEKPTYSLLDKLDAGLRLQNPLSGYLFNESKPDFKDLPWESYNPLTDEDLEGYNPEAFVNARSPEEVAWTKKQVDRETTWEQTAGIWANMFGAVTNPLLLAGGVVGATTRAGTLATTAIEVGAETVSEGMLHAQQEKRTLGESAINIAAAGALTYVLGRSIDVLDAKGRADLHEQMRDDVNYALETGVPEASLHHRAGGAAALYTEPLEQEGMVGGKLAEAIAIGPGVRLLQSASETARRTVQQLADLPFALRKHERGQTYGPSVEARVGEYQGWWYQGYDKARKAWADHRAGGGKYTWDEFDQAVGQSMRRGDVHSDPHVARAASAWRKHVDSVKDRAIAAKMLDPSVKVKFASTYFPRAYDFRQLTRMQEFEDVVSDYLIANKGMDPFEARDIAEEATRKLGAGGTIGPDGNFEVVARAGATKARTLAIPDKVIEPFLESRASDVLNRHFREMGAEVELRNAFHGEKDLRSAVAEVSSEYDQAIRDAPTESMKRKLRSQKKDDIRDIRALRDRLLHTYGAPDDASSNLVRAGRFMRTWTAAAYLGGVVLSSIPDVARPVFQYGLRPYMKGLMQFAVAPKRWGLSTKELNRWGAALDLITNQRLMSLADVEVQDRFTRSVGIFTGLSMWTSGVKAFAGGLATDSIIEIAGRAAAGKASRTEVQKLARAGINEDMVQRITKQASSHGDTNGPLRLAQTADWDDTQAAKVFEAAIRSEVDMVALEPGVSDKWLWTSTEVGKLVGQFQSFAMGITNRGLVAGLQRADRHFLTGLLTMMATGVLVAAVKDAARGRDIADREPHQILLDGLDRSGILGVWNRILLTARKLAGDTPSRSLGKGVAAEWLGPGLGGMFPGITEEAVKTLRGQPDPSRMARLLPYNNLFHVRDILERAGAIPQ